MIPLETRAFWRAGGPRDDYMPEEQGCQERAKSKTEIAFCARFPYNDNTLRTFGARAARIRRGPAAGGRTPERTEQDMMRLWRCLTALVLALLLTLSVGNVACSYHNDFDNKKISFLQCFKFPQTWAVFVGKFMTDGVWWFFLFWTPAYISDVYGFASDTGTAQMLIFVLYAITMLSIYGGKLPTIIINKTGKNPYAARMQAMLIFALFPLLALFAQPLGNYSYWYPIIIIGIAGAAHQSWSANIYSVVGDMFPKSTIATIVGIGGMAGGIGSFCINMGSGRLFDYAAETNMTFMGFEGKPAGYFIIFCVCAVAYLVGWIIMKALVPKYKPVDA